MKIIQVVAYYPPHLGGMEKVAQEISERLAAKGHRVEVFTSDIGCKNEKLESNKNLIINYLKSFEVAHTPIAFSLFFKLLKEPRNSIIHLHVSQAFFPEVVYLISRIKKIPYIAHMHLDVGPSGKLGFLLKPYKKFLLKVVLGKASKIICLTEDQKLYFSKKYALPLNMFDVVPNGVGKEFFLNKKLPQAKEITNLLYVGRLSTQKNIPLLIESISFIQKKVHLDVVGDGEEMKAIENSIRKFKLSNVILHGRKTGINLLEYFQKADIFVVTSKKEGLSLSMLEAMAAGLPIVGNDVPGVRELIYDCGILVSNSSPESFAEALDNLISDIVLQRNLSKRAQKKAICFSWDHLIEKIEAIYGEILSEIN